MLLIFMVLMMLMTLMMVMLIVTRAYARQEPSWNENVYRFEQVGHNDVEEELNDVDDEDDGHHRALQVAVLKEELLGDKGYEDIHCQVDSDADDHADYYADDVDGEDDDGADYVFRRRILPAKSCSAHWAGNGVHKEKNAL